jgi:hypothetical protein
MTAPTVPYPLIPGEPDVEFRFTIATARLLERATRPWGGIGALTLRGNNIEVLVATTHHALLWNKPNLKEQKVIDWIQAFVDEGGDVIEMTNALNRALEMSGVYGKPDKPEVDDDEPEGVANPQTPTTAATTTSAT